MESKALIQRLKAIKPAHWLILFIFTCVAASLLLNTAPESGLSGDEKRLSAILSAIEGAGKTEAMLYYRQTEDAQGVFASGAKNPAPVGAIIVSEGAGDIAVRLNLIRAARTLLGLPEGAVEVFIMESPKKERLP